jgi:hypothetical protein
MDRGGVIAPTRGFVLVDQAVDVGMADALPHLPDYSMVAVNGDSTAAGHYLLRGRSIPAEELAAVLADRIWSGTRGVAVVSSHGTELGRALVDAMAARGRQDVVVLSTTGQAWQLRTGDVAAGVLDEHRAWQPHAWRAANAEQTVDDLGSTLAAAYASARQSFGQGAAKAQRSPYADSTLSFGSYIWDGEPMPVPPQAEAS